MAVPNIPFYLSQANQEFLGTPTGNASVTMNTAGVAVPGNVSQLAGLSAAPPTTHTLTVGYTEGTSNSDYGIPYRFYGFDDNFFDAGGSKGQVGELTPRTIPGTIPTVVMESLGSMEQDWYFDGNYVCDGDETDYADVGGGSVPNLWIKFPNGAVFMVRNNGTADTQEAHATFKSYVNQTIDITLSVTPL